MARLATEPHMNIATLLDNAPYPLTKVELVEYAQNHGASEDALDEIQAMPDIVYNSIAHVNKHLGEIEDLPNRGDLWASEPSHDIPAQTIALPEGADRIIKK